MNKAIVLVSFGTSNLEAIKTFEAMEKQIEEELDNKYLVLRVFTSRVLTNILKQNYDVTVLGLEKVLFNLSNEEYDEVIVQPIHILAGKEYSWMKSVIKEYEYSFNKIKIGSTLLGDEGEGLSVACDKLVDAIKEDIPEDKNIVFIGHGSKTITTEVYSILEEKLNKGREKTVLIGTLEGERGIDYTINRLKEKGIKDTVLMSLLILPGNHAQKDIAGESNSWKDRLQQAGMNIEVDLKSLLQYEKVREIYINKIKDLINS